MDISSVTNDVFSAQALSEGDEEKEQTSEEMAEMGKEDFLKLLVTQLQTQDPMNPMEDQEFAAQLAQFSSLEQLLNINEAIGNQSELTGMVTDGLNSSMAADMIGKVVQAEGDQVAWTGEGEVPLSFDLDGAATDVQVAVRDVGGQAVFEQDMGALDEGGHEFAWDGTDTDGNEVPHGSYTFSVEAIDSEGEPVEVTSYVDGIVDRVTFGSDGPMLWVGDRQVSLDQVRSVRNL